MNKKIGILIFLLVFLGLAGALVLVRQEQETRRGAAGFAPASLHIRPSEEEVTQSGDTIQAGVYLSVSDKHVGAFDLQLTFDPNKLEIVSPVTVNEVFTTTLYDEYDNSQGTLKLGALIMASDPEEMPSGELIKLADFTVKVKQTGSLEFDTSYSNKVTGYNPESANKAFELDLVGATYTLEGSQATATATDVPEATATQPAEDDDTLTFLVSFLGVEDSSSVEYNPVVDVIIKQGYQTVQEIKNITLQPAEGAKLRGTAVIDQTGSNYAVFIKSKRHLSRKFCQDGQQEHCVGQGGVQLVEGDNSYDFSGLALKPGDLNHPEQGQDDLIDTIDFSFAKTRLGEASANSSADVDYNGVVNGRDIVLILGSLSTKHGELD